MILESVSRIMIISCVYPILPLALCMPLGLATGAVDGTDVGFLSYWNRSLRDVTIRTRHTYFDVPPLAAGCLFVDSFVRSVQN